MRGKSHKPRKERRWSLVWSGLSRRRHRPLESLDGEQLAEPALLLQFMGALWNFHDCTTLFQCLC